MKKVILTSAVILFINSIAFSQESNYSEKLSFNNTKTNNDIFSELNFTVRGNYTRPVIKDKLLKANTLADIIPYYPVNWITHYESVELTVTSNGKVIKAKSTNDTLNATQIKILKTAELSSEIGVIVKYKAANSVTGKMEDLVMNIMMTVIPEVEAEYAGGRIQIRKYLKESVIDKIYSTEVEPSIISFSVDEEGNAINARVTKSSGNKKTDTLLIDAIKKMPKWKPAQNSTGKKVKQDFVFLIERGGC